MFEGRIARRVGVDRNPLRRRSDRVEAWLTLVMVATILMAGPLAAWWAADTVYRDSARAVERDRQHRFQAAAILAEDVPLSTQADDAVRTGNAMARARWVAPNGSVRTGLVEAPPGLRAGAKVAIWTDVHGGPTRPPIPGHPATNALGAGIFAIFGVLVVAIGVLMVVHRRLHRHRMDDWQVEWMFVEPVWSGRRRLND